MPRKDDFIIDMEEYENNLRPPRPKNKSKMVIDRITKGLNKTGKFLSDVGNQYNQHLKQKQKDQIKNLKMDITRLQLEKKKKKLKKDLYGDNDMFGGGFF